MDTLARNTQPEPTASRAVSTYLDALGRIDEADDLKTPQPEFEQKCVQTRAPSIWMALEMQHARLAAIAFDTGAAVETVVTDVVGMADTLASSVADACVYLVSGFSHFNVSELLRIRNRGAHSDFRSEPLPEFADAFGVLRTPHTYCSPQLRSKFEFVDVTPDPTGEDFTDDAYVDMDYPPRPRKYLDVKVTINPNASRVKRRYSNDDVETWGP